ncbi:phage tail terminator protein [Ruegeria sp.]|uniref:phage tail terminator protein n=1 Tax=Ruegeria sp. TaxID=1879320 RepID=UPI003B5A4DB9
MSTSSFQALKLSVVAQLAARLENEEAWHAALAAKTDAETASAWLAARTRRPPFGDRVLGALEAAALSAWPQTPAAIVTPLADDAPEGVAPNAGAIQQVTSIIAVTLIIAAPNDATGASRRDELGALLGGVRMMVAGWQPDGARETLQFRRGRLAGLDGGRIEWREEYSLRHRLINLGPA